MWDFYFTLVVSKILESLFAHKLIKLLLIQCNANLSYANTVDEMYYNSSINVPTCMLFFSMPPTSIIFLVAVPQPLESRTVPVCKEKFCKQAVEIWSLYILAQWATDFVSQGEFRFKYRRAVINAAQSHFLWAS